MRQGSASGDVLLAVGEHFGREVVPGAVELALVTVQPTTPRLQRVVELAAEQARGDQRVHALRALEDTGEELLPDPPVVAPEVVEPRLVGRAEPLDALGQRSDRARQLELDVSQHHAGAGTGDLRGVREVGVDRDVLAFEGPDLDHVEGRNGVEQTVRFGITDETFAHQGLL